MLTNERLEIILSLLKEKQIIKIKDIIDATNASESTIRRDLTELENQHKLERVFGGAMLPDKHSLEPNIADKSTINLQEKISIAQYAASLIEERECIFLDAGSTTFQMIPFLKDRELIVVTNGYTHVNSLVEMGITTYVTGGLMKTRTGALVGTHTIKSLKNYRFDKCFLGVNGFHKDYGFTTPDPEEAAVKQLASSLARKTYVVADPAKYNKVSFAKVLDLEQATLIVSETDQEIIDQIAEKTTVKVVGT